MTFLNSLALAGGVVVTSLTVRRKPKPPLINVLINGEPKTGILLPPQIQDVVTRAQQLTQDLFGDTRQQQQQALNTAYDVAPEQSAEHEQQHNVIVAAVGLGLATLGTLLTPIFYLPSIGCTLYVFRMFFKEGYHVGTKEGWLDHRVVWPFTIVVGLVTGYIWASAFGAAFCLIIYYLVSKTENNSKQRLVDLFGGQIRTAWVLIDGIEVERPFEQVEVGDTVVVHAGQMIPVDGEIVDGAATVDQHMLTGESQPVEKGIGDAVMASTVLLSGQLWIQVQKAGSTTVAAQIAQMLNETEGFQRTLRSRTDRMLNRMVLPILGLSALAIPLVGLGGAVSVLWCYPGVRMLVFGPLSMLSYLQVASQRGILIKDGRALETLYEIDTVVFDKTGTLTLEQPTVSQIFCGNGITELALTEYELLRYAAAAEAKQSHPIARAILQAAAERGVVLPALDDAEYKVGYGLKVQIDGCIICVGSLRFMQMEGITPRPTVTAQQAQSHALGHSLIAVAIDGELAGLIELRPTLRPEASQIVDDLHRRGIETVIISGDNEVPTQRLATELGIDRYFAEVLPEDKANLVRQLQAEGRRVCFVGDGINDSIALKSADAAVSLRGATTIATDMAEIVFMDGTLAQLPTLFDLVEDFDANMRTNMLASTLPCVVGIAGTLLFGWGVTFCIFLVQTSTPVGVYNTLKPLLDERKQRERLPNTLLNPDL